MTVHPQCFDDVLYRLYDAVPDAYVGVLDDLVIAAGFRRRCDTCDAMAGPDDVCENCCSSPHCEITEAILDAYGPAATTISTPGHRHLIARTRDEEGIFLIRDRAGRVGDLTENTYEECVREAKAAGLAPRYRIHSRYNLFDTSGVQWTQIPHHFIPTHIEVHITSGTLTPGCRVHLRSDHINFALGALSTTSEGTFLGDFHDLEAHEPYFMFGPGRIGTTPQSLFALPAAQFAEEVLAAYGPFRRDAQDIHEGRRRDI